MEEAKFIKAFNSGYIMSQYTPALIESLKATPDANNPYLQGILSGAKQYEKDKGKDFSKTLSNSLNKNKDQNKDLDTDRDHE